MNSSRQAGYLFVIWSFLLLLIKMVLTQIQFLLLTFEHVLNAHLMLITSGRYEGFEIPSDTEFSTSEATAYFACTNVLFLYCIHMHKCKELFALYVYFWLPYFIEQNEFLLLEVYTYIDDSPHPSTPKLSIAWVKIEGHEMLRKYYNLWLKFQVL